MGGLEAGDGKGERGQVMHFEDMVQCGSQVWCGIGKSAVKVKQYRFDGCGLGFEFRHDGKPSCN
jgi:hypothetical protein